MIFNIMLFKQFHIKMPLLILVYFLNKAAKNFKYAKRVMGFPCGSDGKESACNEGEPALIPESGRFPEKGMVTHSSVLAWKIQ